jgi:hypothetical protein
MEFDPRNNVIKRCVQGMDMEEKGKAEEASSIFLQASSRTKNFRAIPHARIAANHH